MPQTPSYANRPPFPEHFKMPQTPSYATRPPFPEHFKMPQTPSYATRPPFSEHFGQLSHFTILSINKGLRSQSEAWYDRIVLTRES
jgi:hypothetical protein